MFLPAELRALCRDDAPQQAAQAAVIAAGGRWRDDAPMRAVRADLATYGAGQDFAACPALVALFAPDGAAARGLAEGFAAAMVRALGDWPLAHAPFRHFCDAASATLLLARAGPATLSLVAIDGAGLASRPAPRSADFPPTESRERILAGSGTGEVLRLAARTATGAWLERSPVVLAPGAVLARDGAREALAIARVDGSLVLLRLQRRRTGAEPTREYALADGALLHQAAGDPAESRAELAMAVLGRMGRADAVPAMLGRVRAAGSPALRWQALREALALDTAAGFAALCAVADTAVDPLAGPAQALRGQLQARHPELAALVPCPA